MADTNLGQVVGIWLEPTEPPHKNVLWIKTINQLTSEKAGFIWNGLEWINIQGEGFDWKGIFDLQINYIKNDIVSYHNALYIKKNETVNNIETPDISSNFDVFLPAPINGTNGQDGSDGSDGISVPLGGLRGQFLTKNSDTDYDFTWSSISVDDQQEREDGKGWTGANYNPINGIITFTSDDGLGFQTSDIRGQNGSNGTDGKGWTGGVYNENTGVITFNSDEGLDFYTGDLRGQDGEDGQGIPTGGETGQILAKIDSTNYNTEWIAPSVTSANGKHIENISFANGASQVIKHGLKTEDIIVQFQIDLGTEGKAIVNSTTNGQIYPSVYEEILYARVIGVDEIVVQDFSDGNEKYNLKVIIKAV